MTSALPSLHAPRDYHLFEAGDRWNLLLSDGSRIFTLPEETAAGLLREGSAFLEGAGLKPERPFVDDRAPRQMPMRALSLAIAQKCNLGCQYCYAQGGDFGGPARKMPADIAREAVDRLLEETPAGEKANLAFLGGEPLANREALRDCADYAARRAENAGVKLGFSITTNGTLLEDDDAEFFERHGFAVTISIDGIGETHDRLRPTKGGRGTYDRVIERVTPLLALQRRMQVSARVTVTPLNLELVRTLTELIALGFHTVGFSPLLSSPNGNHEMSGGDLEVMLEQMIDCGRWFEESVIAGERYPFSNMKTAMEEIHKGTHRPYPCGAGAGYLGVSAEGGLFACHRFVDDEHGAMGDLATGVDPAKQEKWLSDRHVHFQEPCNQCWARYLCGGGCHHEVIHRGRPACDYIRGWLHYCLQAYVRLLDERPDYFGRSS